MERRSVAPPSRAAPQTHTPKTALATAVTFGFANEGAAARACDQQTGEIRQPATGIFLHSPAAQNAFPHFPPPETKFHMMTLGATLYVQDSKGAAAFYCQAFGMTIGYNALHPDGTYLHAELEKDGHSIFAVSESPDAATRQAMLAAVQPTMSLGISLADDDALQHAYESLATEGRVLRPIGSLPWSPRAADVVDRYGVCWYLYVSQHRPD